MLEPQLTGRTRHRVNIYKGFLRKVVTTLVLQHEVKGFVPEYYGGPRVEGTVKCWWVDSKPEWLLEDKGKQPNNIVVGGASGGGTGC